MNLLIAHIKCESDHQEIFLAILQEFIVHGIEQKDTGLDFYLSGNERSSFSQKLKDIGLPYEVTYQAYENQNWNTIWEESFSPIDINNFCTIRADFHPTSDAFTHHIIINPKMAFGTGHHATTYLMIMALRQISVADQRLLDFGAGTGILAILAAKMGARSVRAIENDPVAYENLKENVQRNQVEVDCILASKTNSLRAYDLILTNITRNVITENLPALYDALAEKGRLVCSGFYQHDVELICHNARACGLQPRFAASRNDWWCLYFQRDFARW